MGDPSYFRLVPASVAATPIDWTRVPEASKKFLLVGWGYDWEKEENRPLPATIADLAKMFNKSKFFGYFRSDLCTLLLDISEFGLQARPDQWKEAGPRFYMKYLEQVWFLLFVPGKRDCISGYSEDVRSFVNEEEEEEGEEEQLAAEETVLAEMFDVRLQEDISRGLECLLDVSETLGGWQASRVQGDLETAQLWEAMMTLPRSHPAKKAFFSHMFNSSR